MASGGNRLRRARCVQWLKHCLLVIETVGLEASVTLEVIFMIANIQTLGVPIRFSSLPGTISAAMGVVLIPSMGFIMDKWAKSKSAKAKILIGTSMLEIVGSLLIFTANTIKLIHYDDTEYINGSTTFTWPNTTMEWVSANLSQPVSMLTESSHLEYLTSQSILENTTFSPVTLNVEETAFSESYFPVKELPASGDETVRYFAILAMIGYCLLDCGYDSSNCFVKTFALASTSPSDHSSIIVKSVFVSSLGGCLIAVLGSIGLGGLLTAGTTHDGSAAQSACVAGLAFVLLVSGLSTTLITGFCCSLSETYSYDDLPESPIAAQSRDEKTALLATDVPPRGIRSSSQTSRTPEDSSRNFPEKSMSGRFSGHAIRTAQQSRKKDRSEVLDHAVLSTRTGIIGFVIRQKKQIMVNVFTFFTLGALYSFEVYAVNFVGDGIFQGNPSAPVGSEGYQNYLHGIEVGSQGTLIYYIVFTICTSMNELLLNKIGWKIEVIVASAVYVVVNLVCAITVSLWAYYAAAVWTGIYRAVAMTVPYILANKFAIEEGNGRDSGVAIAMVAAMLPCGFTVSSAVMGPLIDSTGNPATPLYYTAVTAFLGLIVIIFLKSD